MSPPVQAARARHTDTPDPGPRDATAAGSLPHAPRIPRGPGVPHRPNEVNARSVGRRALTAPRGRQ